MFLIWNTYIHSYIYAYPYIYTHIYECMFIANQLDLNEKDCGWRTWFQFWLDAFWWLESNLYPEFSLFKYSWLYCLWFIVYLLVIECKIYDGNRQAYSFVFMQWRHAPTWSLHSQTGNYKIGVVIIIMLEPGSHCHRRGKERQEEACTAS